MENTASDIFSVILREEFKEWKVQKDDNNGVESFDPLTLIESFIESEMTIEYAFNLFDVVVDKIKSYAPPGQLTYSHIQNAVSLSLIESKLPESQKYLSNYDINFGPDLEIAESDETYINVRHAKSLKQAILKILLDQTNKVNQKDLEDYLGVDELRGITNRLIKIVRFCGFYKVKSSFLTSFLEELSLRSVKSIIPNYRFNQEIPESDFNKIQKLISMAKIESRGNITTSINFLEMALEELGSISLRKFGLLPLSSTRKSFKSLIELLKEVDIKSRSRKNSPEYQSIIAQIESQKIPIQSLYILCDEVLDSINKKFLIRACKKTTRLLRNLKIILAPDQGLVKLNRYRYLKDNTREYIDYTLKYLSSSGFYIRQPINDLCLEVPIDFEYHELIDFGTAIRFWFFFATDEEDFSRDWLQISVEDIISNDQIISVIITNTDIHTEIKEELQTIVRKHHRCICILNRDQFENALRRPEEIRDITLTQFESLVPFAKELKGKIFKPEKLNLPEDLNPYTLHLLKESAATIRKDSGSEACLQLSKLFESTVREYIMLIYSLYHKGLRNKKFAPRFDLDHIDGSFKKMLDWLEYLRERVIRNRELKRILFCFLPDNHFISEIHSLRVSRNDYVHMNREVSKIEAQEYFKRISAVISQLSKLAKIFKRGIFIRNAPNGVEVFIEGEVVLIEGKHLHQTNTHLSNGCCVYVSKRTNIFPIIHAVFYCNECHQISLLDNANSSGSCICSMCCKSISIERGWHSLVKKSAKKNILSKPFPTSKSCYLQKKKGKQMSGKKISGTLKPKRRMWLKAIGEAVATAAGPVGAPLKGLLTLQNETEVQKFDLQIDEIILGQQQLASDLFDKFITLEDKLNGFKDVLAQTMTKQLSLYCEQSNDPNTVYNNVMKFGHWSLVSLTDISTEDLITELVNLYGLDYDLLFTDLYRSGYNTSRIKRTGTLEVDVSYFVASLKGQSPHALVKIFEFIQSKHSGSKLLNELTNQLKTISSSGLLLTTE